MERPIPSVYERTLIWFRYWRGSVDPSVGPASCPTTEGPGVLCQVCFGGYIREHLGRRDRWRRGIVYCIHCKCPHLRKRPVDPEAKTTKIKRDEPVGIA